MLSLLTTDLAEQVINRYTQDAPVRVDAIAREIGLAVIFDLLEPEVSGKIVKDTSGKYPAGYTIFINTRDPVRRQRFTLAHELGHYMLHRPLIGDGLVDDAMYRSKLGDFYEREANRWAANILMPPGLVKGLYAGGMRALAQLSNTLDVSEAAIRIRLDELGLAA